MDNLLKRINFFESLNKVKCTTLEGEHTLAETKKMVKTLGENFTISYKVIDNLLRSEDPALQTWARAKSALIEKKYKYSYRVGLLLERIKDSKQIGEANLYDKIKYLREMDESSVVEHVKRNALEKYRNVPEINFIHESINGKDAIEKPYVLSDFEVYTAISPMQQKNGNIYFMLEGAIIAATPDNLEMSQETPSNEFAKAAEIIGEIPYDINKKAFVEDTEMGTVAVNPKTGSIALNDKTLSAKELKENTKKFISSKQLIEHAADTLRKKIDKLVMLSEMHDMLCVVDTSKTVKNLMTNESVSVIIHPNNSKAYILERSSHGNRLTLANSLTEAITEIKSLTNINISESFKKELAKEKKVFEAKEFYSKEAEENLEKLEKKLNEIDAEIALADNEESKKELESLKSQCNKAIRIIKDSLK